MEDNELKIFENNEFGKVRTLKINGEPYFVGKDVASILGYKDIQKAVVMHIDEEDKKVLKYSDCKAYDNLVVSLWSSKNDFSNKTIINESGLYSLILSSKLPNAKKFKRWVTSEVLPSIRKDGGYIATNEGMSDEEIMARALMVAQKTIDKKNELLKQKDQIIGELKPKADYTDTILQNKDTVPISLIAKDYGMSAKAMNNTLHELKVQYKQGKTWLLYSNHQGCGYTHSKTIEKNGLVLMNTQWTQKGRLFIYNLLKENEIIPLIEREDKINE